MSLRKTMLRVALALKAAGHVVVEKDDDGLPPFDFFEEYDWDWDALADEAEGNEEFPGLADALRDRDNKAMMRAIRGGSGNTRGMSRDLKDVLEEFEDWMSYRKPRGKRDVGQV